MKLLFELSFSNHRNRFVHFNNDLVVKFCFRETIETIAITPSPPSPPKKKPAEIPDDTRIRQKTRVARATNTVLVDRSHRSDTLLTLARNIHPRLSGRMRIDREKKRADGYRRSEMIVRGSRHARSSRSGRRGHWAACSTTNHG